MSIYIYIYIYIFAPRRPEVGRRSQLVCYHAQVNVIWTGISLYIYIYIYIYIHICMYVCMSIRLYINIYATPTGGWAPELIRMLSHSGERYNIYMYGYIYILYIYTNDCLRHVDRRLGAGVHSHVVTLRWLICCVCVCVYVFVYICLCLSVCININISPTPTGGLAPELIRTSSHSVERYVYV